MGLWYFHKFSATIYRLTTWIVFGSNNSLWNLYLQFKLYSWGVTDSFTPLLKLHKKNWFEKSIFKLPSDKFLVFSVKIKKKLQEASFSIYESSKLRLHARNCFICVRSNHSLKMLIVCKTLPKLNCIMFWLHGILYMLRSRFYFIAFDYLKVQPNKLILTENQCSLHLQLIKIRS